MNYTYDFASIPGLMLKIISAFPVTLQILLWSLLISIILGALVTVGSLSKNKIINAFCNGYIAFMRGIPTLVMIFLLYLGFPKIFPILNSLNKMVFIVATLSLTVSANMSEMMRASYLAVDKGQKEAAYSVGMKSFTAFRRIVFPQALGIAIPTLGNNIILLFKETSLAFTIGCVDILGKARAITAASYGANKLEVYIASAIIFWVVCVVLEQVSKIVEKIYTRGRKKATS